jgi:hypothetical protein
VEFQQKRIEVKTTMTGTGNEMEAYLAPRLSRGSHLLSVLFHTVTSQL